MHTPISVKSFNVPENLGAEASNELQHIEELFKRFLAEYEFVKNSGVTSLHIALIFNLDPEVFLKGKSTSYQEDKVQLFISNNPPNGKGRAFDKQHLQNMDFRYKLDILLKETKILDCAAFDRLSVLLVYNNTFDDLNLAATINKINHRKEKQTTLPDFISIKPKFKFSRIILQAQLEQDIRKTLEVLKSRKVIYEDWGFEEVDPQPKAILNFHGPSGTGKTITAHAVAAEVGRKILALKYSEIESKYVGDAPKNLAAAFEQARKDNAVIFFDEADSFLGRRITNVSSSSDQAVNSLRSQMLIQLEEFEGIVIFATNLVKNYDKAFESRIFKHLKFELPNSDQRKSIILKHIPIKVPFSGTERFSVDEIEKLVQWSDGFSGREIKNAILEALTNAVIEKRNTVIFGDYEIAFKRIRQSIEDLRANSSNEKAKKILSGKSKEIIETKVKDYLNAENSESP